MRVLVTGASGFIGGNLARELACQGFEVRVLVRPESPRLSFQGLDLEVAEGDLLDVDSLRRAAKGCEALFHAAALYSFWTPDPQLVYRTNVEGTRNVLTAAMAQGAAKAVFTSSESTVGVPPGGLGHEGLSVQIGELAGHYKKSKLLAEEVALDFAARGFPVVAVNPTMPIGPWDVKPTPTGQVVVDFLRRRMPATLRTGMNLIAVEDVARGHILALRHGRPGERYLLGHQNVTFREMLQIIERVTGLAAPRVEIPWPAALVAAWGSELTSGILGRPPRVPLAAVHAARKIRHFDCSKAVTELALPQSPLEDAFRRAVTWFETHSYVARRSKEATRGNR
jgi:dihydroflavonol-4-reductase